MRFEIDYNDGNFAVRLSQFKDDDIFYVEKSFDENSDFSRLSKTEFVYEYIGDEDWFINAYAEYIGNPLDGDSYIFTDRAVEYIARHTDVIGNRRKRIFVGLACAERLKDFAMKEAFEKEADDYRREWEEQEEQEAAKLRQTKAIISVPIGCGDIGFDHCFKHFREGGCTGSFEQADGFSNFKKFKCPVYKQIKTCVSEGRPFDLVRARY